MNANSFFPSKKEPEKSHKKTGSLNHSSNVEEYFENLRINLKEFLSKIKNGL